MKKIGILMENSKKLNDYEVLVFSSAVIANSAKEILEGITMAEDYTNYKNRVGVSVEPFSWLDFGTKHKIHKTDSVLDLEHASCKKCNADMAWDPCSGCSKAKYIRKKITIDIINSGAPIEVPFY